MPSTVTRDDTLSAVGMSQMLWHLKRGAIPTVSAVLTGSSADEFRLDVTFGSVARQCLRFGSSVAAAERAERLFARLHEAGFQRCRPDKRLG